MKASRIDRVFVTAVGAALAAWTACLVILWGWAFDTSGASTLVTLAATMIALSAALLLPGRAARLIQWVRSRLKLQEALAAPLAQAGAKRIGKQEAKAMLRMFAVVTLIAVGGGGFSTLAIPVAGAAADRLGRSFLWAPLAWGAMKLLIQILGMFPLAMGLALTFLTTAMLRGGSGRDVYASICREWLTATALGLTAFAGAWAAGLNLLAAAFAAAGALVLAAMALLVRQKVTVRPMRLSPPVESLPQRRRELYVIAAFAVLMMAMLFQLRLLVDAGAMHMPGRLAVAAGTLVLLSGFLGRVDRRRRPPSQAQQMGAVIGLMAGLLIQFSLAMAAVAARARGEGALLGSCGLLALAAQIPVTAMAAIVLSRQRQLFAATGGRARTYAAGATLGAGAGMLGYAILFSLPAGWLWLLIGAMAILAAAAVGGIGTAERSARQLGWAGCGAALLGVLSVVVLVATAAAHPPGGAVQFGTWLTSVVVDGGVGRPPQCIGCLPGPSQWRGGELSYTMDQTLTRLVSSRGARRWWVVSTSDVDLPQQVLAELSVAVSSPDPAAAPPGRWRDMLVPGADAGFLQAAQTSAELFDGVLLAPMPADHPNAWRCYNDQALQRCRLRTHPTGLMVLRTQARDGYVAAALSVARTFHEIVGPSWAIGQFDKDGLDLLLIGPAAALGAMPRPTAANVYVVSTSRLWQSWAEIETVRLDCPGVLRYRQRPHLAVLQYWFDGAQERPLPAPAPPAIEPADWSN